MSQNNLVQNSTGLTHQETEARISQYQYDTTKPLVTEKFRLIRDRLLFDGLLSRFDFFLDNTFDLIFDPDSLSIHTPDKYVSYNNRRVLIQFRENEYQVKSSIKGKYWDKEDTCSTTDADTAVYFIKRMLGGSDS